MTRATHLEARGSTDNCAQGQFYYRILVTNPLTVIVLAGTKYIMLTHAHSLSLYYCIAFTHRALSFNPFPSDKI